MESTRSLTLLLASSAIALSCLNRAPDQPEAHIYFNGWSSTVIAGNDLADVRESPSMYVHVTHTVMLDEFFGALEKASEGERESPRDSTIVLVVDLKTRGGIAATYFGTHLDLCKAGGTCRELSPEIRRRFGCSMSELGGVPCD